ncbi:linear amide C-N hydrolase [Neisseriaceae bacterium CLB008]|nr:linear amide C-N hydrolase [Neisseriaceae bacterium]
MLKKTIVLATSLALLATAPSFACTRFVYQGPDNNTITARSMDWKTDVGTNIWILPQGIQRDGNAGPRSVKWQAKYGSVIASGYDIATTDGVNEAGLNANLLWLVESEYPNAKKSNKPTLSLSLWAQYVLDNFATVAETVKALEKEPFIVITDAVPGEKRLATLHLSISDSSGDSAIVEYINGKQVIHHSPKYQVMTNSPTFDQQLALNQYWKQIGGTVMLPGTNRAADRFARASFYVNAIPKTADLQQSVASVFSVIRNVSVPFGLNTEEEPNISSTRWRTVFDHKRQLYFFESAVSPNLFWVDLKKVDFSKQTGQVKKLDLGKDQGNIFAGEVSTEFKTSKPFEFLGV